MQYLDLGRLSAIDTAAFQAQQPYPWINPERLMTEEGYQRLLDSLPNQAQFTPSFGNQRAHGQQGHDRFILEYSDDLSVVQEWKDFVAELRSPTYQTFLSRLLGTREFELSFHWHYTPRGCSISPHCDAKHKLGSHIFYFNTERDWDPTWGGQTLLLDDGSRFSRKSAPRLEDFDKILKSKAIGNCSLLFARKEKSWHAMRPLQCPEDGLRKVFIVVINRFGPMERVKRLFGGKAKGY